MKQRVSIPDDAEDEHHTMACRWLEDHGSVLYRYALGKVRREDVAEDLVQDTLLAAWKSRKTLSKPKHVRTWLIAILKNKIVDWLRSTIREQKVIVATDDKWLSQQFTASGKWRHKIPEWNATAPDTAAQRQEFWEVVQHCLEKLPVKLRHAFVLWQMEERDSEAVCQELDILPSNLWVMLHRSRTRLWACLSIHWFCDEPASPARPT
jgi:RNA polymerase sigma-70 factor (TIGR02943 family)